jgi:class 3 adenylate cyclase
VVGGCANCGSDNAASAKFCSECGARFGAGPTAEERKIVTVLFADLVGFTSRSERLDPEDVRRTLAPFHESLRATLERFGGTVEKFIGDAVMAVFGAPVAHEDDAERAVRAGLSIRDGVAELGDALHVRIGINTGEALVAIGADPRSGEGMVSGDVVNTAARLQSGGPVDGVLVGEATANACARQIVFEPHDSIVAKGKAEPVRCALARAPRSVVPGAERDSLPFVGRRRESAVLLDAFESGRNGQKVQLVTIVGVPGIGKSRLVAELGRHIEDEPELTTWRVGRVRAYGDRGAFGALAEIVQQECGILDSDDATTAATKLDAAVEGLGITGADALWTRNQTGPLVGLPSTDDGSSRQHAFAGWRLFLEAMAARSAAVLVFDDLHWADDALLDFIDELVDRLTDVPLLVLTTARPELLEQRPAWGGGKTNALTIGLDPLTADETTLLVNGLVERSLLSEESTRVLLEQAGGNPLYAQEYVRTLIERGTKTADLPETVQGIIAARLDGLSPEEKSLLHDAAVFGAVAWLGGVCSLSDHVDADALLSRLSRKQLLRRERRSSVAGETEFVFTHALIRDVAYSQLTRRGRAERHERAAAWLTGIATDRSDYAEMIVYHYAVALDLCRTLGADADRLRAPALAAITTAARQAAAGHDHSAVTRHTDRALTLAPDPATAAELQVLAAVAAFRGGQPDQPRLLAARDAAIAAGRTEDAVHVLYLLMKWAESYQGDGALAAEYEDQAFALAATLPPGPLATLPRFLRAFRLVIEGHYGEALELTNAEIARAEAIGEEVAVGLMLVWRGQARVYSGDPDGLDDMERACALLRDNGNAQAPVAAINFGAVYAGLGRPRDAERVWEDARSDARRVGEPFTTAFVEVLLGECVIHLGDRERGEALLDSASLDANAMIANDVKMARCASWVTDDPLRCAHAAREILAYSEEIDNVERRLNALVLLARAEHALGNSSSRDTAIRRFLDLWAELGGSTAPYLAEMGLVLADVGRREEIAAAVELIEAASPYADAARAFSDERYDDAAAILGAIPDVPLRDAARDLAASKRG